MNRTNMYTLKVVLLLLALLRACSLQTDEEIDDFVNLIKENIMQTREYVFPTYYKGFDIEDDSSILDFGTYDFIIIGGGTAGTVLTRRLSEVKKWKILLIEGGNRENNYTNVPGLYEHLQLSDYNWGFFTTPQKVICQGNSRKACSYPRGKGLGGSTIINGNVYARGIASDYDKWAEDGLQGWSFQEVLPYFKKVEDASMLRNVDADYRGFEGPVTLEHNNIGSPIKEAFLKAVEDYGLSPTDYNGKDFVGIGDIQKSTRNGRKLTGAAAFLFDIEDRKNLRIQTDSFVTKIAIKDQKARSVTFVHDHKTYEAHASWEVILSAGIIGSPQIMLLSGIGPSDQLSKFNIPVVKDLPVGEIFHEQLFVIINVTTNHTQQNDFRYELNEYFKGRGMLTSSCNVKMLALYRNKKSSPMELMYLDGFGVKLENEVLIPADHLSSFYVVSILLHPKSVGSIALASANPFDFPLIDPNIFAESEDLEEFIESLELIADILNSEPFQRLNASIVQDTEHCGHVEFKSREYWKCFVQYHAEPSLHAIGPCKMGLHPTNSVVNEKLVVHGIENLRVVDGSVIPHTITGHMVATVYMIAEKAADIIKKDYDIGDIYDNKYIKEQFCRADGSDISDDCGNIS